MQNKEIANILKLTGQLLELHGENPFKSRSYSNAAFKIGRLNQQLAKMNRDDLFNINGIGTNIGKKIVEMLEIGELNYFNKLVEFTPPGVIEMLGIKGIGPKKIRELWKALEVESPGELLYACNENRLVDLKGFGVKTQDKIKRAIEFNISNSGKFHYAAVEHVANSLIKTLQEKHNSELITLTGAIRRKCEIIEEIEILSAVELEKTALIDEIPVKIYNCKPEAFNYQLLITTGNQEHLSKLDFSGINQQASEAEIYEANQLPFIAPEQREGLKEFDWAEKYDQADLVKTDDLKGVLHNHTTWSDGSHSLEEMATACKNLGYEYLGVCDHSKTAVYANGLSADQVMQQQEEIDDLNKKMAPFKIFKGIESDILPDGALDYEESILKTFDMVVASVHSGLQMTEEKATNRLIKAVENPYTTILGHPTGRLLLSREGYPIDHKKVIDACAANDVVVELNANPFRLDIDWRWIHYAMEKGVMISINPDAHSRETYSHMYYGVCVARKGGLTRKMTFNALSKKEMEVYLNRKKGK